MRPPPLPFAEARYATLRTTQEGRVALIALDRPQVRNALDRALRADLVAAIAAAEGDATVRAILVAGEGEAFCAGGDLRDLAERSLLDTAWSSGRVDLAVEQCSKPVIGALHGHVVGGGLELALAFTLRVAADNLRCTLSEIELGIFPGLGGTQRLARMVGEARALDLIVAPRPIDAAAALALGLVSRVVPGAQLRDAALQLAQKIADGPPVAMRVAIDAVRRAGDLGRDEGLAYERRLFGIVCATEDRNEGIAAFREKRRAVFNGR